MAGRCDRDRVNHQRGGRVLLFLHRSRAASSSPVGKKSDTMRLSALLSVLLTSLVVQSAIVSRGVDVDKQSLLQDEPGNKRCSRPPFCCCDKFCADKTCECECGVKRLKRGDGNTTTTDPTSTLTTATSITTFPETATTTTLPNTNTDINTNPTSMPPDSTAPSSGAGDTSSTNPVDGGREMPNVEFVYAPHSNIIVNCGCRCGCGTCSSGQSCCSSASSSNCASCRENCSACTASENCRPCSSAGSGKCKDCNCCTTGGGGCSQKNDCGCGPSPALPPAPGNTNDCGCGPFPALPPAPGSRCSPSRNCTVPTTTPDPATTITSDPETATTPIIMPTTTNEPITTIITNPPIEFEPTSVPPVCFVCPCLPTYCQPHPIPAVHCPCTPLPSSYPCPVQLYPPIIGYQPQPYYTQYVCMCAQGSVEGAASGPALPPGAINGGLCSAPCSMTQQRVLCDPARLVRDENNSVRCAKPLCKLRRTAHDEVLVKPEGLVNQTSQKESPLPDDASMRVANFDEESPHHFSSSPNTSARLIVVVVNVMASFVMALLF